jgi:hypothetical protein
MDLLDSCIAERLRRAMDAMDVDVPELARRAGLPAAILADRIAAPASFTIVEFTRIVSVLGCDPREVMPDLTCFRSGYCCRGAVAVCR